MGNPRKRHTERCERCRMKPELCFCAAIPTLTMTTQLVLIMHRSEAPKPTNTGRLATLSIPESVTLYRGHPEDDPVTFDFAADGRRPLLLFPSDEAEVLDADFAARYPGPYTLIVPDGSWRQASKVATRIPALRDVKRVKLTVGAPTQYYLRKETKEDGLATMEGIARALGVLESPRIQKELETVFDIMVSRTLQSRGQKRPTNESQ